MAAKHQRRKKKAEPVAAPTAPAPSSDQPEVEIEYVVELPPDLDQAFSEAFHRLAGGLEGERGSVGMDKSSIADSILDSLVRGDDDDNNTNQQLESKKDVKKRNRPTVALLKQIAPRPALVEVHDVTSPDPELLVFLKSRKMAVAVPRHWSSAAKYLAGKRGAERKPYQLPDYIVQTGIGKLRDAADDSNDSLQKRQRDRARPKLGQISIDYHVLRDAFFKYQTKPRLTRHGELYFEGKEMERDYSGFVPGVLSEELRQALGMATLSSEGAHASLVCPPPWLAAMQKVGPPPSYPGVAFPGVNAPIPPGAQYGAMDGGWGKPPVDHFGRGVFGDVMGLSSQTVLTEAAPVKLWGGFAHAKEAEEEDDRSRKRLRQQQQEEEEEEEGELPEAGEVQQIESFSFTPVAAAVPTDQRSLVPEQIVDLRKKPFRVLDQVSTATTTTGLFGASHQYDKVVVVAVAPEQAEEAKEIVKKAEEELARQQPPVGLAPGAGLLDISQDLKRKLAKDAKPKKEKFKF